MTDLVSLTVDGATVTVPAGTLVIRAAELVGVDIPRFCDHPLLPPAGACRQCLVDIEGQRKPMASCTIPVAEGMVVRTQHSSPEAARAQEGVMELLLINHPLDCPTCDKGGECPLQNQAMSAGRPQTRFADDKRVYTKPLPLSPAVLLDRERCVLCARCTRFAAEIAGDPLIDLAERGALQQVSAYQDEPFSSYFSGNTVQICPVGALTGSDYRFRARPFDLISSPGVCEHCSAGCAQRTDHRRGRVLRRLAGDDPAVNEEWNCDKGRWAFAYAQGRDRLTVPLVRGDDGALHPASWPYALAVAARGLAAARGRAAVLPGGRLTVEDAYAYAKFARTVLGTNHVDLRARAHSTEETGFLAARVAGSGLGPTYADLEAAPTVVLAGLEPEEECPMVFLRLRKAVRRHAARVITLAPWLTPGAAKLSAELVPTVPGAEAAALAAPEVAAALAVDGAVLLVGERLATAPGALTAAAALAEVTGAALAWIPRRAGERGALDVGAAPNLLPAGRPLIDPAARREVAAVWGAAPPAEPGLDTSGILAALAAGGLAAVVTGGIDPADLPDPAAAAAALERAFVVSLEQRPIGATPHADVVLPIAAVAEKAGTFVNWEGRARSFPAALPVPASGALPLPDHRVLHALAAELGTDLNCDSAAAIHREFTALGPWTGPRFSLVALRQAQDPGSQDPLVERSRDLTLASWHLLLDAGSLQDGAEHLAATARPAVARLSPAAAAGLGVAEGEPVAVSTTRGTLTLPLAITPMPDGVVWVPMNTPGAGLSATLAAVPGDRVTVRGAR